VQNNELRNSLIKVAHENPTTRKAVLDLVAQHDAEVVSDCRDLIAAADAIQAQNPLGDVMASLYMDSERVVVGKDTRRTVEKMVGMNKQQIRVAVDAYSQASDDLARAEAEAKAILDKLKKLKGVKAAALKPLTDAAKQLQEKGRICLEGRDQALQMTVYIQDKTPGIIQMLAEENDDSLRKGQKAGELYARFVQEMGEEAAKTALSVVTQCKEDLQHTASAVVGLKLVERAGDSVGGVKSAGLLDKVKDAYAWLNGEASRLFGMAGDIVKWAKGFVMRTKICKKLVADQGKKFKSAQRQIDAIA